MHDPWTTDFNRGYEWFLMKEAKARNPAIKLYGLPWAFPQWVSCAPGTLVNCTNNPYSNPAQTAAYVTSFVEGAKNVYGYDIDYIGSWNERGYNVVSPRKWRESDSGARAPTPSPPPRASPDLPRDAPRAARRGRLWQHQDRRSRLVLQRRGRHQQRPRLCQGRVGSRRALPEYALGRRGGGDGQAAVGERGGQYL